MMTPKRRESSFHFLPISSSTSSLADKNRSKSTLYRDVPALFGLHSRSQAAERIPKNLSSPSPSSSANSGFYKRLLEWLSRKNKTRRRYSELASTDAPSLKPATSLRNQSAPMIFDVQPRAVHQVVAYPEIEESPQSSKDEPVDPTAAEQNWRADETAPCNATSSIHCVQKQDNEEKGDDEIDAEWIIPWSDIEVGEAITHGGSCTINRGRWHGDVIIHQFDLKNLNEIKSFWLDVQSLSKLRHENILLFMGIATDNTTHTIVNSAPRGVSVATFRRGVKNGKSERIGMRAAVSISRQVAQATGYLHARGIVYGKLNPHNIFLEGDNYRVKLSLLDHGLVDSAPLQKNYGCMPKMQLSYYSPELVRSIVVQPPEIQFSAVSTKFSDVYALGSFMYDLIAGHPPFDQEETDSVLWRIGSGRTTNLQDINCNARLKALIESCWCSDPLQRPSCIEVVRRLQPSALLCKSHSCSEPERLNRLGMCKLAC